jgi:hypothetical protein
MLKRRIYKRTPLKKYVSYLIQFPKYRSTYSIRSSPISHTNIIWHIIHHSKCSVRYQYGVGGREQVQCSISIWRRWSGTATPVLITFSPCATILVTCPVPFCIFKRNRSGRSPVCTSASCGGSSYTLWWPQHYFCIFKRNRSGRSPVCTSAKTGNSNTCFEIPFPMRNSHAQQE